MNTNAAPAPIYGAFVVRINAIAMALAASLLAAGAAILYSALTHSGDAELRRQAEFIGTLLAEPVYGDFKRGEMSAARQTMQRIVTADLGVAVVTLLDRHREPLLTYGELSPNRRFESADVPVFESAGQASAAQAVDPNGYVRVFVASEPWGSAQTRDYLYDVGVLAAFCLLCCGAALWAMGRVSVPLRLLELELQSVAEGLVTVDAPSRRSRGLNGMADAVGLLRFRVQSAQREQADLVASHTRDLQSAIASATRSNDEKKRLLAYGDEAVEAERKRIAGELHDAVGSVLVSLRLRAETIASRASATGQEDIREIADRIVRTTSQLYDSTRSIVQMLRPELLEALGLTGAIAEMVRRLNDSQPTCRFELSIGPGVVPVGGSQALTMYRVAQEACTNVLKHAQARHVLVAISNAEPPRQVRLVVTDDGKGLHAGQNSAGSGLGLVAMRERVEASGGILSVTSDGNGTTITVAL